MEGEQGWVTQGVLSRTSFRRPPASGQKYFTVFIAKKLILTLRAIMISQEVDLVRLQVPIMPWKRKNCRTAEAWCRLDPSLAPQYDTKLDFGSSTTRITRDEESSDQDRPSPSRFLLQEAIFAHTPYEGVFHNWPTGNCGDRMHDPPSSRARFLSSVQCVRTGHSTGALPGAMVPVGPDSVPWSGAWGRAESSCFGRTESIYDSDSDLWKLRLDVDGN